MLIKTNFMQMSKRIAQIVICFLLLSNYVYAQNKSMDSVLIEKKNKVLRDLPKTYSKIHKELRRFKKDSLKLQFLLNSFRDQNYSLGESYALNFMGVYCRNTSQYKKAIKIHELSLQKAIEANDLEMHVVTLNMLGVVYRRIDAIRTALDYHYEAVTLAELTHPSSESIKRSTAVSLNSMGNIFLVLKQYDLALEKFSKSLIIEESIGNKLGLAINYHNIGFAKESLGMLKKALADYEKSLQFNTKINSELGKVICHNSIAQIYIKQKKYKTAIKTIEMSLESAKKLRDKFHLVGVYINLGWAYLELNNLKISKEYLTKALTISKEHNFKSSISETYSHLSRVSKKEDNYKQALFYFKESQKIEEEVSSDKRFQYVNDLIIKYDIKKATSQVEVLAKENEIVKLKLKRNHIIWLVSSLVLGFSFLLIYFLYRQRSLQNEKKILTLEQDMLRTQMNPHFVFNSLNSIKQYIIANEKDNAVFYLTKFSKLIRKILEASRVKEVTLAEELETMKVYMSIENIRFSNDINFDIQVANEIDLSNIKIPSLILQPFLENSLWHGLTLRKGEKHIKLTVSKEKEDCITIRITDNGIGREKAAIIKANKTIKRKSFGVALTKARMSNFVKGFKNDYTLNFKDLKENGESTGTQVTLQIPLK